jgi:Fe2+ transport system protein FeoA
LTDNEIESQSNVTSRPAEADSSEELSVLNSAIPLHELRSGKTARVSRILGHPDQVCRFEEFGLRSGSLIEMFRAGCPCIIRMAGVKFCLRAEDLVRVLVVPCPSPSAGPQL